MNKLCKFIEDLNTVIAHPRLQFPNLRLFLLSLKLDFSVTRIIFHGGTIKKATRDGKPVNLDKNPDALPPTNLVGRLLNKVTGIYYFATTEFLFEGQLFR